MGGAVSAEATVDLAMADLPSPWGWFAVAFAHELPRGGVLTRRLAGEELVVWRGTDGSLGATASTCPHLGAHLGQGRVEGTTIRCPFHGFRFGPDGACTGTGRAPRRRPGSACAPGTSATATVPCSSGTTRSARRRASRSRSSTHHP